MNAIQNRRILLVDDMPSIHRDFRKILAHDTAEPELEAVEAALFDQTAATRDFPFELDSAYQGEEGLTKVREAIQSSRPYAIAFVDMRMPAGWDGVETIEHLWAEDPRLQIVICTAHSDYSWQEVLDRLGARDRLLILKKPFDNIEVSQLANTLTAKWEQTRRAELKMGELEQRVHERTAEITRVNDALQLEIVERKQLQSQLVQAGRLAAVGQLAAGVAHEINNPIAFVSSNLVTLERYYAGLLELLTAYESLERTVDSPEVALELDRLRARIELVFLKQDLPVLMCESKRGIDRVREIVQNLRAFCRADSSQEWQWASVERGIDAALEIVAVEIGGKADVAKEYALIPDIECIPSQLNQVLLSLLINAAQAVGPERGKIVVRTGREGDDVWIEVADNGTGIPTEILPRIFDPFFTTKPIGTGTGLGLALSYGVVQKHSGRIAVQSEMGVGSTFRIVLPMRRSEFAK